MGFAYTTNEERDTARLRAILIKNQEKKPTNWAVCRNLSVSSFGTYFTALS